MNTTWQLTVTYDGTDLTIGPTDPVSLEIGDAVVWTFVGIPNNCIPRIEPIPDPEQVSPPFGPFFSLRQQAAAILGKGNSGETGTYPYRAAIYQPGGTLLAASAEATLVNQVDIPHSANEIQVRVVQGSSGLELEVEPLVISFYAGDSLVWTVEDPDGLLPKEPWYPQLLFNTVPSGTVNQHFGPFLSLTAGDLVDVQLHERRAMRLVGSGSGGPVGLYGYQVAIRDARDQAIAISSPDPQVDDRGELTIPPGGS